MLFFPPPMFGRGGGAPGSIPSGSGSYVAYRYMRLSYLSGGTGYRRVREMEVYNATLGTDTTTTGTAIAASSSASGSETPNYAIDNNTGTEWVCAAADTTPKITVDFGVGNNQPLKGIGLYLPSGFEIFKIYGSNDNSTFTQLCDYTDGALSKFNSSTIPVAGRMILPLRTYRLVQTGFNAADYSSIGYIELRNSSGVNLLVDGTSHLTVNKSNTGTEYFLNMLDTSTANDWTANMAGAAQVAYFMMQNQTGVASISMRSGTIGGRAWKDFRLDYSDDGMQTWTTGPSVTGQTSWAANETRVFTL
jgi:hypothetical protein